MILIFITFLFEIFIIFGDFRNKPSHKLQILLTGKYRWASLLIYIHVILTHSIIYITGFGKFTRISQKFCQG